MIWKLQRFLLLHWAWYAHLKLYVIADASDNSVTFSRHLFKLIEEFMGEEKAKVYVTQLVNYEGRSKGIVYAFCVNPPINQDTQLADIQYNSKYHCVGFESLCPTVARICYDYEIPAMQRVKLSVAPCQLANGMNYYAILPPVSHD